MDNKGKEGSFMWIFLVMFLSLAIAMFWDSFPTIKENVHKVLDPSLGALLNWNIMYGMLILVFMLTLLTTLVQKYFTDQKTLKEMKVEQKKLNEELKNCKEDVKKMKELQMKQLEFMGPMMKLSMRPMIFTGVPLILFFRWFMDFFNALGNPKFFGFLSWFWFYLIFSIIFSLILRKVLKVE